MSQHNEPARVIPAQLDFLAIYNPTLGTSDDDLKDQIVYYYSRRSHRHARNGNDSETASSPEEEQNQRLRQIGLAQGMITFAKNFSDGNVDNIETDKSRIVLHELEKNWWVLASIDLTRLPAARIATADNNSSTATEYSAREVAPAKLLQIQLDRANSLFLLHHARRLSDLIERVGRETFCSLLERYWNKFVRNWDVLLHGNPATTIYNATKLSGGGELGIGVGEEEWGSGEREVLEDFIDRTEGLREVVVGRYGFPPPSERKAAKPQEGGGDWLGVGNDVAAADGLIFSGTDILSRKSLRTVSQWMEAIFKYGEDAYGIGENPSSRPRPKRKRQKVDRSLSDRARPENQEVHPRRKSPRGRAPDLRKRAMENNAAPPGIPAPLVGQVERSLDHALATASGRSHTKSPKQDKPLDPKKSVDDSAVDTSVFGTDNMMKYLTLGYGSSWTLNPKGLSPDKTSDDSQTAASTQSQPGDPSTNDDKVLQEVDPTPDVSEDENPFRQRLEKSIGKFLVGLSGDLEQTELDADHSDQDEGAPETRNVSHRLFLRTLNVEMFKPKHGPRNPTIRTNSYESSKSTRSKSSVQSDPKTSASASVDGSQPNITHEKMQIAVYVHQPFIFVFLFELHTPSLTIPSFYRSIHSRLGPLQKPLLRSTDPSRIAQRVAEGLGEKCGKSDDPSPDTGHPIYDLTFDPIKLTIRTSIPNIPVPGSLAAEGLASRSSSSVSVSGSWYTLGIPIGSASSSALSASSNNRLFKSAWSRTEALNAHTQILNTFTNTRSANEYEQTVKTARGWWIIWMKVHAPVAEHNKNLNKVGFGVNNNPKVTTVSISSQGSKQQTEKEAFLVRKAADHVPDKRGPSLSRNTSSGPGRWLLREQKRDVSSASSNNGGIDASAKGVSEGVGVDARKWVEGLLYLTQ